LKEPLRPLSRQKYIILFLSFLVACLSLPEWHLVFAPGIDTSLVWVFNHFADGHYALAKNISFPHGPLAFLLYPLMVGNNLYVAVLVFVAAGVSLGMNLAALLRRNEQFSFPTWILALAVIVSIADIQLLIIAIVSIQCMSYLETDDRKHLFSAIAFSIFNLLIKTYGGIICGLIISGSIIYMRKKQLSNRPLLSALSAATTLYLCAWGLMFGTIAGSWDFLRTQVELATGNSESVQYAQENNWWLLGGFLVSLIITFIFTNKWARTFFTIMLLPLFAGWKHGMARADGDHMGGLLYLMIILMVLLVMLDKGARFKLLLSGSVALIFFGLNLSKHGNALQHFSPVSKAGNFYQYIFRFDSLHADRRAHTQYYLRDQLLPDTIMSLIGDRTADVYPWNYAIVAANRLNWKPRPVINSYAAYTTWLDNRDAMHFASKEAAEFILWEFTDPDEKGNHLESIDYRYLLNDEPVAIIRFFSDYELVIKLPRYLLYKKREQPLKTDRELVITPAKRALNEWIELPQRTEDILRVKIGLEKNITGKLKGLFYKGETYMIYYQLENGKIFTHRFISENAREGLWLSPFTIHPQIKESEAHVTRIMIACYDQTMVHDTFDLAFERISFHGSGEALNAAMTCFGKQTGNQYRPLFYALNDAGNTTHSSFTENRSISKTAQALSPPAAYKLEPGERSGDFKIPDLADTAKFKNAVFRLEGFVKCPRNSEAQFIFNRGLFGSNPEYIRPVKELVNDENTWTHIYLTIVIPYSEIQKFKGYRFYVWNADTDNAIYVDDLSVTVEGRNY
jgi:hypothetical protein